MTSKRLKTNLLKLVVLCNIENKVGQKPKLIKKDGSSS
jgi:hypothetical protein